METAPLEALSSLILGFLFESTPRRPSRSRITGFLAFYKGFWPLFQRKVTWTVIFFTAYEQLRSAAKT